MSSKTRIILLLLLAALVLVWGMGMSDSKDGGYSDETNYFSVEELKAREETIAQMAEMRGETPPPSETPEPEKKDKEKTLAEPYASIPMQACTNSFTLKALGYDKESQILLVEFNMTGLIYAYFDVPNEEYVKLVGAENFDKWFEAMIMKEYRFEQLN